MGKSAAIQDELAANDLAEYQRARESRPARRTRPGLMASGRIACSVAPACPARLVELSDPATGSVGPARRAAAVNETRLTPGRSRTFAASPGPTSGPSTSPPEPGNQQHPRGAARPGAGTTWSSKATTAATRKDNGTGRPRAGLAGPGGHTFAVLGTPSRCSVLPGRSR